MVRVTVGRLLGWLTVVVLVSAPLLVATISAHQATITGRVNDSSGAAPPGLTDGELNRLVVENVRGRPTSLENGILRVRRKGGWARTRQIIADFVLTGEFRLLSTATELQIGLRTINTIDGWPARGIYYGSPRRRQ